ncbi:hypothetical protein AVMA1855_13130 [Acidovorax sp. SUPP1855]|uniref:hypothetical protein n=1 Tax=Acidovorax sp. SUPP1855 TaxID=431774 RepID=UPI0023DE36D7|nr:hypothetical protein [Acidovorax sp. SUPP1855]GKS85100.1 hypothetical protein AVMA1855_13130 [Acidovorax sp. SUPP1855]
MRGAARIPGGPVPGGPAFGPGSGLPWGRSPGRACARRGRRGGPKGFSEEVFDDYVADFRRFLDDALAAEPCGPARHLRAYLRAMGASLAALRSHQRRAVAAVLGDPRYAAIWSDFVEEMCATDSVDLATHRVCRYAIEGLRLDLVQGRVSGDGSSIGTLVDRLLSLTVR